MAILRVNNNFEPLVSDIDFCKLISAQVDFFSKEAVTEKETIYHLYKLDGSVPLSNRVEVQAWFRREFFSTPSIEKEEDNYSVVFHKFEIISDKTKLTPEQKLQAFSEKYCLKGLGGAVWNPQKGDYYTSSINDLELYQIIDEDEFTWHTVYCKDHKNQITKWDKKGFLSEGFGLNRIWVPDYILK